MIILQQGSQKHLQMNKPMKKLQTQFIYKSTALHARKSNTTKSIQKYDLVRGQSEYSRGKSWQPVQL
jgi:hypothetical protein